MRVHSRGNQSSQKGSPTEALLRTWVSSAMDKEQKNPAEGDTTSNRNMGNFPHADRVSESRSGIRALSSVRHFGQHSHRCCLVISVAWKFTCREFFLAVCVLESALSSMASCVIGTGDSRVKVFSCHLVGVSDSFHRGLGYLCHCCCHLNDDYFWFDGGCLAHRGRVKYLGSKSLG